MAKRGRQKKAVISEKQVTLDSNGIQYVYGDGVSYADYIKQLRDYAKGEN